MSNLSKYVNLHAMALRTIEDDLTEDQSDADAVAFTVGRVVQSVGNTIEEAALRIHKVEPEVANRFYAAVSSVAQQTQLLVAIVGEAVAPLADVTEMDIDDTLKDVVHLFDDGLHSKVLGEASQFLGEHLKEGAGQ